MNTTITQSGMNSIIPLAITNSNSPWQADFETGHFHSIQSSTMGYFQAVDKANRVNFYTDPITGKMIGFNDYWYKKEFEAQPAFVCGKFIRETIEKVGTEITLTTNAFVQRTADLCSTFYHGIKQLPHLFSYSRIKDESQKVMHHPVEKKAFDKLDINKLSTLEFFDLIVEEIKELHSQYIHDDILAIVKQAKASADLAGLPLMILLGEDHYNHEHWKLEKLFLEVSKKVLNIQTVYHETFRIADGYSKANLPNTENYLKALQMNIDGPNKNHVRVEQLVHHLGIKYVPIDYIVCFFKTPNKNEVGEETCKTMRELLPAKERKYCRIEAKMLEKANSDLWVLATPEAIRVRDQCMSMQMIYAKKKEDSLCIVGGAHVSGIANLTDLGRHYFILGLISEILEKRNHILLESHNFPVLCEAESRDIAHYKMCLKLLEHQFCPTHENSKPCQTLRKRTKPLSLD
jgi:hypothetical protein